MKLSLTLPGNTEEIIERSMNSSVQCPQKTVWTLIDFLMEKKRMEKLSNILSKVFSFPVRYKFEKNFLLQNNIKINEKTGDVP